MAKFCNKCGTQMDDNLMFCSNCGAKVDGAPAPQATYAAPAPAARPAGSIDFMGILTGKTDAKTNWIAAIVMQVLSVILFFLPMIRIGRGDNKETESLLKLFGEENPSKTWMIVMLVAVCAAIIYMLVPVFKNTKLVPAAALVMTVTQLTFFLSNFIYVLRYVGLAEDYYSSIGTTFGFWAYAIISAAALFAIIRVVVANKKELV